MIKYSVIVPVYNAEKTIKKCLDSLVKENYPDAEVIIVNDGSNDSSGEICKTFAGMHNNIRYFKKTNGGVSSARNYGIKHAVGTYILFVDSDDYVADGFFSKLDSVVNDSEADLYQFSYIVENEEKIVERISDNIHLQGRELVLPELILAICRKRINSPCCKVYKRNIVSGNNIFFPEGVSNSEDRAFNIHYSFFVNSYVVSEYVTNIINTTNENSLSRRKPKDLQPQLDIAEDYIDRALATSSLPENEKKLYNEARNYSKCITVYRSAKNLRKEQLGWFKRQQKLWNICGSINQKRFHYPKSMYCLLTTLPVQFRLTVLIDLMAKKLNQ